MKKTLMVLTFALCATFVFAQTMTPSQKETKAATTAKTAVASQSTPSSIFTKDNDVLLTVDFHDGTATSNMWTGTNYTTGAVMSGANAHSQFFNYAYWQRWTPSDETAMENMYSRLSGTYFGGNMASYFYRSIIDTAASTGNNGFMMISYYDQGTAGSGIFNAYVQFAAVDASEAPVVDVQFYQTFRRYYDKSYLDYSTDGSTWVETEINVTGVDVQVNGSLIGVYTYTLPLAAAGEETLYTRIRAYSDGSRGSVYGYFWVIDDVNIISGPADRLNFYAQEYVEGAYGIVPQGLELNPAWYSQVKNTGTNAQSGLVAALASASVTDGDFEDFATKTFSTLAAGNTMDVYCDNAGWLYTDSLEYRGWHGYAPHTSNANAGSTALPTATAGEYLLAAGFGNETLEHYYDTMYYNVVAGANDNGLNGGYRWAHDNGVLVYSPYNYWIFGYVNNGGTWYVTEDADDVDFYAPGYRVLSRYTTDATVPADWVIRGVEMVASPVSGYYAQGAQFSPVLIQDTYDGGSVSFGSLETGAGVYTTTSDDVNDTSVIGRNSHGYQELGNYNTIYIPFPEQPALEANTSYRVGYMIETESYITMAAEAQGYYREASPSRPDEYDTIIYFKNNPSTSKYANYYTPNGYQGYVIDPINTQSGGLWAGYYVEYSPMIRLVVGPAIEYEQYSISFECEGEGLGQVICGGEDACGEEISYNETSTITFYIYPSEGCEIAGLTVDNEVVTPELDENCVAYEDEDEGITYWAYTISNISANHVVSASFQEKGDGFDPIAAAVRMNLQPNPATSQVSLNVEGVEGMVNCSIIDMSGRVVYSAEMNTNSAKVIDLNGMAKGAYFVRVTNNNFTKVEKLIVR